MRAALHLHAVELAVRVERGQLESDVLRRYGAHLGAVSDPDIDVLLRLAADEDPAGVQVLDIRAGAPLLELAVVDGPATDAALGALAAPMLVRHGAILLRATVSEGGTLAVDPDDPAAELLLVHRASGRWRATATAFGDGEAGYPRRTTLRALRLPEGADDREATIVAASVLGAASADCQAQAERLVGDLVRSLD